MHCLPTEDRFKKLDVFQKLWILENIRKDNLEEKMAWDKVGKHGNSFGNNEDFDYDSAVEELKNSMGV